MKIKYILTAFVMLASLALVRAEYVESPRGNAQALATADYGGVDVATSAFSAAFTTACLDCQGVFHGILFSSGNAGSYDFVDVYDASTTYNANLNSLLIARLYNVSGSTASGTANISAASGFSGPPKPLRFRYGLIFKPGVATYNLIDALFYKARGTGN